MCFFQHDVGYICDSATAMNNFSPQLLIGYHFNNWHAYSLSITNLSCGKW